MAVDSVPSAVGGGAVHTADIQRVANNMSTRDSQGINLPHHFKVTATSPVSGSVTVAGGGVVIRNIKSSGQSFIGRGTSDTSLGGLTNAGSHMIVARIIGPESGNWQPSGTPGQPNTSVANGPYFDLTVVTGVAPTATKFEDTGLQWSAEALARVDNPAGSGQITSGMIKDLRRLAQPRTWTEADLKRQTSTDYVTSAETAWHDWPLSSLPVDIPTWATDAICTIRYGVKVQGPLDVDARVALGSMISPVEWPIDYNSSPPPPNTPANVEVLYHEVHAKFDVTGIQGAKEVSLRPQARRNPTYATVNTGSIWSENTQQVSFRIDFKETLR